MLRAVMTRLQETNMATHLDRWITGGLCFLLVLLGFLVGRWTALTSRPTPIVFQEAPGGETSAASPTELRTLAAGAAATVAPEVRGAAAPPRGTYTPTRSGALAGAYVASANGAKYYHPSCPEVRRINDDNKLWFDSEEEAKESGYQPSVCVTKVKVSN